MKKRWWVWSLFISIFLRNQFLSNARWFYSKKHKTGKGNLYLTENQLNRNQMWCVADNHTYNICVTYVQKNFQIQTLIQQLLTKHKIFTKLPQSSHNPQNRIFKSIIGGSKCNSIYFLSLLKKFLGTKLHIPRFTLPGSMMIPFMPCTTYEKIWVESCEQHPTGWHRW